MPLNLIKLSVGSESVESLSAWIATRLEHRLAEGGAHEHIHTTRMVPRRRSELLKGSSIYWVIRGMIQCRQDLIDIRPFTDEEGIKRCQLVMRPELIPVMPRLRGAFQGWRYFEAKDAPPDIAATAAGDDDMPAELRRELAELGLL